MSSTETIKLVFEPTLRVAGETVQGEVHLNFPGLIRDKINEVHVKLRGYVYTRISTRRVDQMKQEQRLQVPLIHENISLWEQGVGTSSYPSPGSDILIRPFSFKLPSTLLPSCEYGGLNTYVCNVRYFVQVVGRRPGKLKLNERHLVAFPVLPALASGAKLRETFQQGWRGPWRATAQEKDVRRGIWGDHSHVKVTLDLPDIEVIPIFTSIPYTITITTHTKPMARDEGITDDSLFPVPPTKPEDVSFWLESDVFMKTKSWTANRNDNFVSHLGGLGPQKSASQQNRGQVEVQTLDKVWIPEGEKKAGRGRWKQEVVFRSMLRLNCAPSFDSETLNLRYRVKLRVDFPGIGNSLKEEFPIHIVSSIHPPEEQAWDGPPPELDLPPDYYKAASWDGDSSVLIDEKD